MVSRHRWAKRDGETERLVCRRCGVARRRSDGGFYYQQWWGGWHHGAPPCMALDGRRRVWEQEKEGREISAIVKDVVRSRIESDNLCVELFKYLEDVCSDAHDTRFEALRDRLIASELID